MGLHHLVEEGPCSWREREAARQNVGSIFISTQTQFCQWANNRVRCNHGPLPVVRGVWVRLTKRPAVDVKLQGGDRVKNKAFWQPCQPPASYFPDDVSADVGLYPGRRQLLAQWHHYLWNYMCSGIKHSIHFQTKARQNLLGQSERLV